MGNRAVITTPQKRVGIYLHWNGGRDSVEAFLTYCKLKGYRSPDIDNYGWARLCQIIGNFFGGTMSLGIDEYNNLDRDNYDNGVYIIEDWKIVGREFKRNCEQTGYDLKEFLYSINESQPQKEQLTKEEIDIHFINDNVVEFEKITKKEYATRYKGGILLPTIKKGGVTMLMEYDDKTIPYTIEYAKENTYKVWLNSQMYLIYKFYETAQTDILLINVEAYALKYECFSFHYFYFKKDLKYKHFNLREFRCKNRKYKAERYLNSKKDVITPVATIFKEIYEDIPLF